jgi:hypothetical protein
VAGEVYDTEAEAVASAQRRNRALGDRDGDFANGYYEEERTRDGRWEVVFRERPITWGQRLRDLLGELYWP